MQRNELMTKIESAVLWMERLAADNSHGYAWGGWGPQDYDCGHAVITAWEQVGVIPEGFRPEIGVKGVTQGRQPFFIGTNGAITCGSDITDGVCALHVVYL